MHTMNFSIQDVMSNKLYHEISAGGVVVNTINGEPRFVVIDRANIRDTSLPKGHQETGESLQQTAIREVFVKKPATTLNRLNTWVSLHTK